MMPSLGEIVLVVRAKCPMAPVWSEDDEILFFNLICDHKPAGKNKAANLEIIVTKLNEHRPEPLVTQDVEDKLSQYWDMQRVDEIEGLDDEEEVEATPKSTPAPETASEDAEDGDDDATAEPEEQPEEEPAAKPKTRKLTRTRATRTAAAVKETTTPRKRTRAAPVKDATPATKRARKDPPRKGPGRPPKNRPVEPEPESSLSELEDDDEDDADEEEEEKEVKTKPKPRAKATRKAAPKRAATRSTPRRSTRNK